MPKEVQSPKERSTLAPRIDGQKFLVIQTSVFVCNTIRPYLFDSLINVPAHYKFPKFDKEN